MINVFPQTKIYVACPAGAVTGGPELLHQLVHNLRATGINAYIFYHPVVEKPKPLAYEKYDAPYVFNIADEEDNVLIIPEIFPFINFLKSYKRVRKVIWWLSVNNFFSSYLISTWRGKFLYLIGRLSGINGEIIAERLSQRQKLKGFLNLKNIDLHMVQSFYAFNFLRASGVDEKKIVYLSDYLNDEFLIYNFEESGIQKENIVLYNPKKGFEFTKKIIEYGRDINFVPIINMSRREVIETMKKAKVYIDFGNHPGKDRMPREAAMLGCCVITGKRGSAAFFEDVPIKEEYKFEDKEENIPAIVSRIRECIENYEEKIKDFEDYRKWILYEKERFINDMKNIFVLQTERCC